MDMAAVLDEMTYRLLASARSGPEARRQAAIVGHWAAEQGARLASGKKTLRVDNDQMVAEALAAMGGGPGGRRRQPTARLAS